MTPRRRAPGSEPTGSTTPTCRRSSATSPSSRRCADWCLGAGLIELLQITDIRVCSPDARFGLPEIAYGMGGAGGMTRIGRQIPHTVAMKLMLTGEPIDADEALACFLVNEVAPPTTCSTERSRSPPGSPSMPPLAVRVEMEAYAEAWTSTD